MNRRLDWRAAYARLDPSSARRPVTLFHPHFLLARGLRDEAVEAYREFLTRFPEHPQALESLGLLLRRLGRAEESAAVLAEAARVESKAFGSEPDVAEFLAAADAAGPAPNRAPPAFVATLYDHHADRFESLLVDSLGYRAPAILLEAVTRAAGPEFRELNILDLGCGTGLAGAAFKPLAKWLGGVDLSPKMLERAAAKGIYDELVVGDVVEHLQRCPVSADLIVAADVFIYLGVLGPVFMAAQAALRPGGRLAFTVEAGFEDQESHQLQGVRRFTHPRGCLERAAAAAGLRIELLEECSTRTEGTLPVRSWAAVMAK